MASEDAPQAEAARVLPWLGRAGQRLRALSPGQMAQIAAAAMVFLLLPLVVLQRQAFVPRTTAVYDEMSDVGATPSGEFADREAEQRSDGRLHTPPESKPETRPMADGEDRPMDNETGDRLRGLGYINESEPDPVTRTLEKKNREQRFKGGLDADLARSSSSSRVGRAVDDDQKLPAGMSAGRRAEEDVSGKDDVAQVGAGVVPQIQVTSEARPLRPINSTRALSRLLKKAWPLGRKSCAQATRP